MAKKGGGKQDKDADFEVFNKIQEPGASLDDLLLHFDWSADKDMLARLDDWSAVDKMIEHLDDRSALDEMFAHLDDCSVLDKMFAHLDDWSTLDAMFPVDLTFDKLGGLFQPIDEPNGKRRSRRTGGKPRR